MSGYQISDEDVEVAVRYMRFFNPENANPEYCRAALEAFHAGIITGLRNIALDTPDAFEELFEKYEVFLKNQQ